MPNRLKNKISLITGAAKGIGAATAKLFANEGSIVFVADIDQENGLKVANEINNNGDNAIFYLLDVTDEQNWIDVLSNIQNKCNKLDILVNNAGISVAKSISDMSLDEWRKVMSVNLDSVFLGTKYAMKLMQNGGGNIINVSSVSGIVGSPMSSAYCASKGAVTLFTKAIALECAKAKNNIRINSIHPAGVETSIWEKSNWWPDFIKEMGSHEAALKALSQASPLGRMAKPDEIAKCILFLATEDSSYMTGSQLIVDGGYTAQ